MTTLVRITDPQQARELYEAGLLMFGKTQMCDHSWSREYTDKNWKRPDYLEDAVVKGISPFYIRIED